LKTQSRKTVRADENLTPFLELEVAIGGVADYLDKRTDFSRNLTPLKRIWPSPKTFPSLIRLDSPA
jgi:hypothetical protein